MRAAQRLARGLWEADGTGAQCPDGEPRHITGAFRCPSGDAAELRQPCPASQPLGQDRGATVPSPGQKRAVVDPAAFGGCPLPLQSSGCPAAGVLLHLQGSRLDLELEALLPSFSCCVSQSVGCCAFPTLFAPFQYHSRIPQVLKIQVKRTVLHKFTCFSHFFP